MVGFDPINACGKEAFSEGMEVKRVWGVEALLQLSLAPRVGQNYTRPCTQYPKQLANHLR